MIYFSYFPQETGFDISCKLSSMESNYIKCQTCFLWKIFYTSSAEIVTQGPVVQSVFSLTSSLVVKMLTVLVSTISNSQVFFLKKWE